MAPKRTERSTHAHSRTTSRGRESIRQTSPAMSDTSELSGKPDSPSPTPAPGPKQPSLAFTDATELFLQARTPSPAFDDKAQPPPEDSPTAQLLDRQLSGRSLHEGAKRAATPVSSPRLAKRLRSHSITELSESRTPSPLPVIQERVLSPLEDSPNASEDSPTASEFSPAASEISSEASEASHVASEFSPTASEFSPTASEFSPTASEFSDTTSESSDCSLHRGTKRAASPEPSSRSTKRLRSRPATVNPRAPRSSRVPASRRSPTQARSISSSTANTGLEGFGKLLSFPKEIRELVYYHCLGGDTPICVKQCCGPNTTRRARASCKKHGDQCSKIGKGNGLTLYEEDENHGAKKYGRFNILSLSRHINQEASHLLNTQCKVLIQFTDPLEAYLGETNGNPLRLPNHAIEDARRMWLSVARFRNVELELPWSKLCMDHPVVCVNRLYEAAASLMKAWSMQTENPTVAPNVTIQLNALYTAVLPFNSETSAEMVNAWTGQWEPDLESDYLADFGLIGQKVQEIIERSLDLVGRHGGSSIWKVETNSSYVDDKDDSEDDDGVQNEENNRGVTALLSLEDRCGLNGVAFGSIS